MGDSCSKVHVNISVQAEVFVREGRESRTKNSGGGDCRHVGHLPIGFDVDLYGQHP